MAGDLTAQAYRRDPQLRQRREAMEKWGELCSRPEPEPPADNVVSFERKA